MPTPEKRIEKRTVSASAPVDPVAAKVEAQAAIAQAAVSTGSPATVKNNSKGA